MPRIARELGSCVCVSFKLTYLQTKCTINYIK